MRLIGTFDSAQQGKNFSNFLFTQGIENSCEITEKGSRVWIKNEDFVPDAWEWLQKYQQNPLDPQFQIKSPPPPPEEEMPIKSEAPFSKEPIGVINFLLLILCGAVFLITQFTTPPKESAQIALPLFASPVKKALLYDYPEAYTLLDQLVESYGPEALTNLPKQGQQLLQQYEQTPYWRGFYERIVAALTGKPPGPFPPLFEKIREGEVWRLFTPVFLHADIFHLIFNMIWLIVIGKQMEKRLGMARYLLFIIAAALFSNTAQYLMSGPNFIGFSGVLCGMVVFVWVRQNRAPWEGYFMQPATWTFFAFFILLMFSLQFASFLFEITLGKTFPINIANTAHLSGALIGYWLGRLNYFSAGYR